jgi:membrane-bound serine protease (ClpP class)
LRLSIPIPRDFKKRTRRLRIFVYLAILLVGALAMAGAPALAQNTAGAVYIMEIEGIINPPVANYAQRVFFEAERNNAALIVMIMDTPGGLDTSMRIIIQEMFASQTPVAVYVAPSGARAASAGLFLLVSGHIAAMAPGTNTGSAHPVGLGGENDEVMTAKVVEDAAATIRTLATERGRNAEWAERAVRESVNVTEREALDLNVIEIIAANLDDLLRQIDGMTVSTINGDMTLQVSDAPRVEAPMNFAESLLHVLSDPNIAFILLSLGSLGLLVELYNPGVFFPGITGIISLIFAFFSLGNLPTNWAGVALITFAVVLFIAELNTDSMGVLGVGSLVAFVLGGLILFRPFRPESPVLPELRVDPWVVGGVTAFMGVALVFIVSQLIRARKTPISSGVEFYKGRTARVFETLNPNGRVWFEGQTWNARLHSGEGEVEKDAPVRVLRIDGLTLIVEPIQSAPNSEGS